MKPEDDKIGQLIRQAGTREINAPLAHERAKRQVRKAFEDAVAKRQYRRRQNFGIAATAVLGLALWLGLSVRAPTPPDVATKLNASIERLSGGPLINGAPIRTETRISRGDIIETGPSGSVTLGIGPERTVRLDRNTWLKIRDQSDLTLNTGRLYVDAGSTSATRAPLTIDTPLGTAREIGTQFSLQLDASKLYVRVREGRVDLLRDQQRYTATAYMELHAKHNSGEVARQSIEHERNVWAWAEALAPVFEINDITLHAYLGWVARETGRRLIYRDRAAQDAAQMVRLRGSIDQLTPEQSLAAVIPTTTLAQNIAVTPTEIVVTSGSVQ